MTKKTINVEILKYITITLLSLILANLNIFGLNPFLFAFCFALIFVGFNEKIVGGITLASSIIVNWNLENFFISLTVVLICLIIFYAYKFIKKNENIIIVSIGFIISLITLFYYNFNNITYFVEYAFLGTLSLFCFVISLQALVIKKNCLKLTLSESICFLYCLALIGGGLYGIKIFNIEFYRLIFGLLLFFLLAVGNSNLLFSVVISCSLGLAISSLDNFVIGEFVMLALLGGLYKMPHKIKIVVTVSIVDIFLQFYFVGESFELLYSVLPIIVSGLVFLVVPNKFLNSVSDLIYVKSSEISSRNIINITRKGLRKRMIDLSNIFLDMKNIHSNMVRKELSHSEMICMFEREINANCCKDCLEKNRCHRALGLDNKSNIETLLEVATAKGKVSLLDIPPNFANKCLKINNLIGLTNRLLDEYGQYKRMIADINNVKILLADQMGAVSKLLLDIGDEIDTNVSFDLARENKIIAKLLNANIECREVLIYNEKNNELCVVVIAKCSDDSFHIIEKSVGEVLTQNCEITKISSDNDNNFLTFTLRNKSRYDCAFGLSFCNKSGNLESGDCHSIIRLGRDKFLLALCDGMGAGKKANIMSTQTLGLIENFYKAGFDNDVIVESVNKLLSVNNQESYSTLDVCLLDLNVGLADFIKVGAPLGLIKREASCELVSGGALPIGALDEITPSIQKLAVDTKDIVILMTDGVVDAFKNENELLDFVSKLSCNNPQTIADSILNRALELNEMSAKDDMTVLVARTFLKS